MESKPLRSRVRDASPPGEPPLVTVVIPAYNRETCLGEAIESVLAQAANFPYEVLVVDDGSTDSTAAIARSYSYPVRVLSKQNGGPASARNAGVLSARSRLIALLDSDDLMSPGRLAQQAGFLQAHPEVVLTFGDLVRESDTERDDLRSSGLPYVQNQWLVVDDPYRRLLTEGNFVNNVTTMFRKEDYITAGMMDESLRVSEDYELWSRMCSIGKFAYYCAPFARVRRDLKDNLMSSPYARTDRAIALHRMLLRDRVLRPEDKQKSLALLRERLRNLLRYDLRERGRRQMLGDLREIGSRFGRWYFVKWWMVSLTPRPAARLISRFRSRATRQAWR